MRQKYMSPMKEQDKTPIKEPKEVETSSLPNGEFKTLIIRMLNELKERVDEFSENFNKEIGNRKLEIEIIKMNQSVMKNTVTEMKNTLEGINCR